MSISSRVCRFYKVQAKIDITGAMWNSWVEVENFSSRAPWEGEYVEVLTTNSMLLRMLCGEIVE